MLFLVEIPLAIQIWLPISEIHPLWQQNRSFFFLFIYLFIYLFSLHDFFLELSFNGACATSPTPFCNPCRQVFSSDTEGETIVNEPVSRKKKHKHFGYNNAASIISSIPSCRFWCTDDQGDPIFGIISWCCCSPGCSLWFWRTCGLPTAWRTPWSSWRRGNHRSLGLGLLLRTHINRFVLFHHQGACWIRNSGHWLLGN